MPSDFGGGARWGDFTGPEAVMTQLKQRTAPYPIRWGAAESAVPWLVPGRLLAFVKYTPLVNDTLDITAASVDGTPVLMRKAYNTIVRSPGRFIGWFADLTALVKPGTKQTLRLTLPQISTDFAFRQGFITAGSDLGKGNMSLADAKTHCNNLKGCAGFTFRNAQCGGKCPAAGDSEVITDIMFKATSQGNPSPTWCAYAKPPRIDGVFFENVETLKSTAFTV